MEVNVNEIGDGLVYCPQCGCYGNLRELGVLGSLTWLRCGDCGWDFAVGQEG